MSSKLEKIENNVASLTLEIPTEDFEKAVNSSYIKNVSKFNIPGFRKGKAPKRIIERFYGEEVFYEDAIDAVFPSVYEDVIKENNITPVDRPSVDIKQIGKNKDLILTADVTIKPEVVLGEYKGIEVEKVEYNVTDEDVDKEVEKLREKNARMINVDNRPVKSGDIVLIDFKGFIDGAEFKGGSSENYSLEIGSNTFIPGFEDQLIGKNINDDVDVKVKFPDDYKAKNLAGKDVLFKVKIKEIRYKELPAVDDEFVKDISEFDTIDELKKDIRSNLEKDANLRAKNQLSSNVVQKVVDNTKMDIPEVMVKNEIDMMVYEFDMNLRYQGITLENYLKYTNMTMDKFRESIKDEASNKVRTDLVIEKISKLENIEATDEDINNRIEELAKLNNMDVAKYKESVGDKGKEQFKERILREKTIEFLTNNSKIIDKK